MKTTWDVLHASGKDDWETPPELFFKLDEEFRFSLDVAANPANAKCGNHLGPGGLVPDALVADWRQAVLATKDGSHRWANFACWCNPPYSRGLQGKFIAKASMERVNGIATVMLLPARTDTKAFHAHIWDAETHRPYRGVEVRFLPGRLKFVGAKDAAPFPSMVVVFRA